MELGAAWRMTWGAFNTIMGVAPFAAILLFGPSWARRWLLTCLAAVAATALIGVGIMALTVDDPPADEEPPLVAGDWVAVYHVGELPEAQWTAFLDAASFDVFAAVASCWEGLPSALGVGPDRSVSGVWAVTEDKLEAAMRRVPGEPLLVVEARNVCPTD